MRIRRTAHVALLVALLLSGASSSALAANATIGLYSDNGGSSCSFSGSGGPVNAYVVVRPGSAGLRAVRFSATIPSCFDATWLAESVPSPLVSVGSSATGISISSPFCENEPFLVLQITYIDNGGTTPCCGFSISPDPTTGTLEAVDCVYAATPISSVQSRFNANATCPCGAAPPTVLPPDAPGNPLPADQASYIPVDTPLRWTASDPGGLALVSDVYFGTTPNPPLMAVNQPTYGNVTFSPGHLAFDTTYYWRIVVRNSSGLETSGPVWSFSTGAPPTLNVTLIEPANGATNTSVAPVLKWHGDSQGLSMTFDVYLGKDPSPPMVAGGISLEQYAAQPLEDFTTYYWRVVVHDVTGRQTTSPVWTFTTRQDLPPSVTNISPQNGALALTLTPTLSWSGVDPESEHITYDVYFGDTADPPAVATNLTVATYAPAPLSYLTTYYWRVIAHDTRGNQGNGPLWWFRTKAENEPPDAPNNPSPSDGLTDRPTSLTLSWQCSDRENQPLTFDVYLGKVAAPIPGASIGLYTDATGSTCSFNGNPSGIVNAYVVVKPQNDAIRAVRFSAPPPSCFGATYLYDNVAPGLVSIGSSQSGISISSPSCESQPFYVLQIGYMATGSTTPCCEYPVIADPFVGNLEAVNCAYASTPIKTALSHFNADNSCACNAPALPRIYTNIKTKNAVVSNLLLDSYYQWRVVARDTGLLETAGPVWTFQTKTNQPPAAPSIPAPANNAVNIGAHTTLAWQCSDPESQTLKYDIYFGTSNPPPLVKSDNTTKSYNPGSLAWVTTYWWRIVARDTYGATASSATWSFTTKPENLPPGPPQWVSPANGATGQPVNSKLVWTGSDPEGQALKYDVYFGTETIPPMVARDITAAEYVPLTLAVSTTYRWRVVARDTGGLETTSATWSFQTSNTSNQMPTAAGNPSPPDGSATENTTLLLQWYAYDPDHDPLTYTIIGTNDCCVAFAGQTNTPQFSVGPLEQNQTYHWSVAVSDGHWYVDGPSWSFYISGGGIPVLVSSFDATPQRDRVNVKWELSSDEDMDSYTLLRRSGENGVPRKVTEGTANAKGSFLDTSVEPGRTYLYELVVRATSGSEFRSQLATAHLPDLNLALYQNQPNPFNPQTTIRYDLPAGATRVRLLIADASGRRVRTLVDETQSGGARSVIWNGHDDGGNLVASGVYFYVLDAGKQRLTKKLVLLK